MTTEFTLGATYACPLDMIDAGNELMYLIGYGPGDRKTFFVRKAEDGTDDPWLDADGNPFAVANGRYKQEWVNRLAADLDTYPVPEWAEDVDLALAKAAQKELQLVPQEGEPAPRTIMNPLAIRVQLIGLNPETAQYGGTSPEFGPFTSPAGWVFFLRRVGTRIDVGFDFDPDIYPDFWVPLENLIPGTDPIDELIESVERRRRYL